VKKPWKVTPRFIDAVLAGMSCDLIKVNYGDENLKNGEHDGRLAVEQLYGYMIRNAKTLGLISTMKG